MSEKKTMNREDLILSCSDIVDNLVKKYNNHKLDEDLHSIGMIAVVQCVDKCLEENMSDINQIQARCNIWARNTILKDIYKQKLDYEDNTALEYVEAPENNIETMVALEQILTPRQKEVFELLIAGYDKEEIMDKLNIKQTAYYQHESNIREKIKSLKRNF